MVVHRERVLGLDPGYTTGYCSILRRDNSTNLISYGEIELNNMTYDWLYKLIRREKADRVVIEDVVKSGHLSTDKFNQIRAFDRCYSTAKKAGIEPEIISPEIRKRGKSQSVPDSVKGTHARDAYLIATYDTIPEDMKEEMQDETQDKS